MHNHLVYRLVCLIGRIVVIINHHKICLIINDSMSNSYRGGSGDNNHYSMSPQDIVEADDNTKRFYGKIYTVTKISTWFLIFYLWFLYNTVNSSF